MRHSSKEWRNFCMGDFVVCNGQMILFVKKNVHFICIFKKKVVSLHDYIHTVARVYAYVTANQTNK